MEKDFGDSVKIFSRKYRNDLGMETEFHNLRRFTNHRNQSYSDPKVAHNPLRSQIDLKLLIKLFSHIGELTEIAT